MFKPLALAAILSIAAFSGASATPTLGFAEQATPQTETAVALAAPYIKGVKLLINKPKPSSLPSASAETTDNQITAVAVVSKPKNSTIPTSSPGPRNPFGTKPKLTSFDTDSALQMAATIPVKRKICPSCIWARA